MSRARRGALLALMLTLAAPARGHAQDPVLPTGQRVQQATPWDSSLTLEAGGHFAEARAVLIAAFGSHPAIYDVAVRLAWLSLEAGKGNEAVAGYRAAIALPGALTEATQGLATALVMAGYQALDRGDLPSARHDWQAALATRMPAVGAREGLELVGPSSGGTPEFWFGHLKAANDSSAASAIYLALPYRVNDHVSVRGAFRSIGGIQTGASGTGIFGSQQEYYGSVTVEQGVTATEVMALALSNTVSTISGLAASTRVGGKVGASLTLSALHQSSGWNTQIAPSAFAWLGASVAIWGGVRLTHDSAFSSTSPLLGATIRHGRFEVDGQGHFGKERLAFGMAGPTVMSFVASTASGTMLTGSLALGRARQLMLFAQWQGEQLRSLDGTTDLGHYTALAAGFRWQPGRTHLGAMP